MGALDCVSSNPVMTASTESTEVFSINKSSNISLDVPTRDVESQELKSNSSIKTSTWWTIAIDGFLVIIVLTLLGLFELGVISGFKGGFYCNDPALSHPFTGDTVSMAFLTVSVLVFPLIIVLATEFLLLGSIESLRSCSVQVVQTTAWIYRNYAYGFFFNLGIVEVMKGITGSPRPTFFDICEPDTGKTCNGSEYVRTFECTSMKYSAWFQTDSYRSFPSGHTSLSVYCAFFIAWYLQRRAFDWRRVSVFVVPVVQLAAGSFAALSSLTRMTDHRHHWWDVLVGTAIGLSTTYYAVIVLCKNFSCSSPRSSDASIQDNGQPVRTLV